MPQSAAAITLAYTLKFRFLISRQTLYFQFGPAFADQCPFTMTIQILQVNVVESLAGKRWLHRHTPFTIKSELYSWHRFPKMVKSNYSDAVFHGFGTRLVALSIDKCEFGILYTPWSVTMWTPPCKTWNLYGWSLLAYCGSEGQARYRTRKELCYTIPKAKFT